MAEEPESLLAYARLVIEPLEAAQVVYLLGGALATAAWAEPRSTLDVDLVISLTPEQIVPLSRELAERGILLPPELILDQLVETREDIALVAYHREASFKAEFFLLRPGDELRATALGRRVKAEMEPPLGHVYVHSPEDLILYKLHYFSLSQQTRHVRDITSLLAARRTRLDYAYLEGWVQRLGLQSVWQAMRAEARARRERPLRCFPHHLS